MTTVGHTVVYHANCADGFCSAYLFWRCGYRDFMAAQYGDGTFEKLKAMDGDITFVDFSLPRSQILELVNQGKSITILDHHKTAEAELRDLEGDNLNVTFDMEKSGARLAFEHLGFRLYSPHLWLVDYTEDRDLWRWKLPNSKEVSAAIASYPFEFSVWDKLRYDECVISGTAILRYQNQMVDKIAALGELRNWEGYEIRIVNTGTLVSEVGDKLGEGVAFAICYFRVASGEWIYSLRSKEMDISEVAKRFGGGGHPKAAGFKSDKLLF